MTIAIAVPSTGDADDVQPPRASGSYVVERGTRLGECPGAFDKGPHVASLNELAHHDEVGGVDILHEHLEAPAAGEKHEQSTNDANDRAQSVATSGRAGHIAASGVQYALAVRQRAVADHVHQHVVTRTTLDKIGLRIIDDLVGTE